MIKEFFGEYRFLSNFYPCHILHEGICYSSVENAYVASKTTDEEIRRHIATLTPGSAKTMGKTIDIREDWSDDFKLALMRELTYKKYIKNPDLMKRLQETKGMVIVEGNTWGDTFWGQSPLGKGRNELGKIIMAVRDDITIVLR